MKSAIRVALRIRPSNQREEGNSEAIKAIPGRPQVHIASDNKSFTFNYVFSPNSGQSEIYNKCVQHPSSISSECARDTDTNMIDNLYRGYNATILAYGQTGSGKTYTMGTTHDGDVNSIMSESTGIIPRVMKDIFERATSMKNEDVTVKISFLELYREQIFDLLHSSNVHKSKSGSVGQCELREDCSSVGGGVVISGLTEVEVGDISEAMHQMAIGTSRRVTAATAMNSTSSRSHCIVTLHLIIQKSSSGSGSEQEDEDAIISAKFRLVDLAGSERQKRTQAQGERLHEGVSINQGLLALGNVISSLGEKGSSLANVHIPYRSSKLTRLLQDSLGGNAITLMMACITPSSDSLEETMGTLRYADRVRKIKNQAIINVCPKNGIGVSNADLIRYKSENERLKQQINELREEIMLMTESNGIVKCSNLNDENSLSVMDENRHLTSALIKCQSELSHAHEKLGLYDDAHHSIKSRLSDIIANDFNVDECQNNQHLTELRDKLDELLLSVMGNERTLINFNLSYDTSIHVDSTLSTTSTNNPGSKRRRVGGSNKRSSSHKQRKMSTILEEEKDGGHEDDNKSNVQEGNGESSSQSDECNEDGEDENSSSNEEDDGMIVRGGPSLLSTSLNQHSQLAQELSNLNKLLSKKEELAHTMTSNGSRLVNMQMKYQHDIEKLEGDLAELQKEHEELLHQQNKSPLPSSHVNKKREQHKDEATSRIAESRRLKINDLEVSIQNMKKKIVEQQKMIKVKDRAEREAKKLASEIQQMKSQRVKLVRQMKEESEKNKIWKSRKEREVMKLKQSERKQNAKLAKLETLNTKQQRVFKRKMEEASSVNRRLKDLVEKQKAAKKMKLDQTSRTNSGLNAIPVTGGSQPVGGNFSSVTHTESQHDKSQFRFAGAGQRMRNWINDELELAVCIKQADHGHKTLVSEKDNLTKNLKELKRQMRLTMSNKDIQEVKVRIQEIEEGIDMRDKEIQSYKTHISQLNNANSPSHPYSKTTSKELLEGIEEHGNDYTSGIRKMSENVNSLTEAIIISEHLFNEVVEKTCALKQANSELSECKLMQEEIVNNTVILENEIETLKRDHTSHTISIQKEHEEKVSMLLNKLSEMKDIRCRKVEHSKSSDRTEPTDAKNFHSDSENENTPPSPTLYAELSRIAEENERLRKELEIEKMNNKNHEDASGMKKKKKKRSEKNVLNVPQIDPQSVEFDSTDDDGNDDGDSDDPDWKKTPLFRRLKSMRNQRTKKGQQQSSEISESSEVSSKNTLNFDSLDDDTSHVESKQYSEQTAKLSMSSTTEGGANTSSMGGGGGSCKCKTGCKSKICKCFKLQSLCNSKCGCDVAVCKNNNGYNKSTLDDPTLLLNNTITLPTEGDNKIEEEDIENSSVNTISLLDDSRNLSSSMTSKRRQVLSETTNEGINNEQNSFDEKKKKVTSINE